MTVHDFHVSPSLNTNHMSSLTISRHQLTALVVLLSVMICGCRQTGSQTFDAPDDTVDMSHPAYEEAHRMASLYSPDESAGIFLGWLLSDTVTDTAYARELAGALAAEYDFDAAPLFGRALDSLCDALPRRQRVRLYVTAGSPLALGAATAHEGVSDTDSVYIEICNRYVELGDTASLALFERAYRFGLTQTPAQQ